MYVEHATWIKIHAFYALNVAFILLSYLSVVAVVVFGFDVEFFYCRKKNNRKKMPKKNKSDLI